MCIEFIIVRSTSPNEKWGLMAFILSGVQNQIVYDMSQGLMEKLAIEAMDVAMVSPFEYFSIPSREILFYCCFKDVRNVNLELGEALNLLINSVPVFFNFSELDVSLKHH